MPAYASIMKKLLLILVFFLAFIPSGRSHKFYTSITQLEYNPQTKSAEIMMRVFWDDWESALGNFMGRKVRMDDKDIEAVSLKYLEQNFRLSNAKNKARSLHMVGVELQKDMAVIYLEASFPEGLHQARISQLCLTEQFDTQVNLVNVIDNTRRQTLVFRAGSPAQQIRW